MSDDLGALLQRVPIALRGAAAYHVPKPAQIVAKLDANEFPYPLPASLRAALADVVKDIALERYPDPNCTALRAQLASDCNVAPNQIIFGNGSDELISIIVNALAAPRDTTRNAAIEHERWRWVADRSVASGVARHRYRRSAARRQL